MPKSVAEILTGLRASLKYTQCDVAEKLAKYGVNVSNQAVSKWETGTTQPNAQQFIALCKVLNVDDIMGTFEGTPADSMLSRLSKEGRAKAKEYIQLLVASGLYDAEKAPEVIELRTLPLYGLSASAGTGQFLDSSDYELVEVGNEVPQSANFGVRIAGDSMEPRFIDGQIVWVHQQQELLSGEIGVFLYDGNAYCKKLEKTDRGVKLVSLNFDYTPINVHKNTDFRVFGRVVG